MINREEAILNMKRVFQEKVQRDSKIYNAYLLVHSDKHDIHFKIAEGNTGSMVANPDQPFFIASIGKLFTSVLIGILVEEGKLRYEDTITTYVDSELIENLHVYKGKDYSKEIRVKQLLNHTSGLHDYFEDKPKQGERMIDILLNEPSRFWTPPEVVRWSKEHLTSHFEPGKGFHYSDTGYHLLGIIIENITSMPLHNALKHYIFEPLQMKHSYLLQHSKPIEENEYPIANLYLNQQNITNYQSLSIDYAGGGIVATSEDLLKFMGAVVNHTIIREETFEKMKDWAGFFNLNFAGIDYGYGLMNFKAIPIYLPKKYSVWGNAGAVGAFMFYHPELETYFIGSLNQFRYHRKGIQLMFRMIRELVKSEVYVH